MKFLRFWYEGQAHYGRLDGELVTFLASSYLEEPCHEMDCLKNAHVEPNEARMPQATGAGFLKPAGGNHVPTPHEPVSTGRSVLLSEVKLLAPSIPTKIVAVGLNYKQHAGEMNEQIPDVPKLFLKPPSAVIGDGDTIAQPDMSSRVDYEAELAFVIGKTAKNVPEADALSYVFGYTCLNDVTARDLQSADGQWTRAKGFDTFAPVGPFVETDFDPDHAVVRLIQNGTIVQEDTTEHFLFRSAYLVSFISRVMTLYPGDIITTGTPAGIGPMKDGDKVEVAVEGLMTLTNYFKAKP